MSFRPLVCLPFVVMVVLVTGCKQKQTLDDFYDQALTLGERHSMVAGPLDGDGETETTPDKDDEQESLEQRLTKVLSSATPYMVQVEGLLPQGGWVSVTAGVIFDPAAGKVVTPLVPWTDYRTLRVVPHQLPVKFLSSPKGSSLALWQMDHAGQLFDRPVDAPSEALPGESTFVVGFRYGDRPAVMPGNLASVPNTRSIQMARADNVASLYRLGTPHLADLEGGLLTDGEGRWLGVILPNEKDRMMAAYPLAALRAQADRVPSPDEQDPAVLFPAPPAVPEPEPPSANETPLEEPNPLLPPTPPLVEGREAADEPVVLPAATLDTNSTNEQASTADGNAVAPAVNTAPSEATNPPTTPATAPTTSPTNPPPATTGQAAVPAPAITQTPPAAPAEAPSQGAQPAPAPAEPSRTAQPEPPVDNATPPSTASSPSTPPAPTPPSEPTPAPSQAAPSPSAAEPQPSSASAQTAPPAKPKVTLGVKVKAADADTARRLGVPEKSILFSAILPGGPAEEAQLLQDDVLLELGGKPITDMASLLSAMAALSPDAPAPVLVKRNGMRLFYMIVPKAK